MCNQEKSKPRMREVNTGSKKCKNSQDKFYQLVKEEHLQARRRDWRVLGKYSRKKCN
jgi:hypothetical protein